MAIAPRDAQGRELATENYGAEEPPHGLPMLAQDQECFRDAWDHYILEAGDRFTAKEARLAYVVGRTFWRLCLADQRMHARESVLGRLESSD